MEKEITKRKLKNKYGEGAPIVLIANGFLKLIPAKVRRQQTYKVLKALPDEETYRAMRDKHYATSVELLIDDAFSLFDELKDELQSWHDNMPEAFQNGDKGSQLQECIDALENLSRPEAPERLNDFQVVFIPDSKISSRSSRLGEANRMLQEIIDDLEQSMEGEAEEDVDKRVLIDELENVIQDTEAIEFPSMYG